MIKSPAGPQSKTSGNTSLIGIKKSDSQQPAKLPVSRLKSAAKANEHQSRSQMLSVKKTNNKKSADRAGKTGQNDSMMKGYHSS